MPITQLIDVVALSKKQCQRPIQAFLAYATPNNFLGQLVEGYTPGLTDFALMTKDSAIALCEVQQTLLSNYNLGLLIYDSYRPKRAVQHFVRWSKELVTNDFELKRKEIHYPNIEKSQMFELGYISAESQHCYGNTVDLVLINEKGEELDLGACFDFMDKLSHNTATEEDIGKEAFKNRKILSQTMTQHGFLPYQFEFWHYSYKNKLVTEPLDIPITEDLRGDPSLRSG